MNRVTIKDVREDGFSSKAVRSPIGTSEKKSVQSAPLNFY